MSTDPVGAKPETTDCAPAIGTCPDCCGPIVERDILIRYERNDGTATAYTECPDCRTIVRTSTER